MLFDIFSVIELLAGFSEGIQAILNNLIPFKVQFILFLIILSTLFKTALKHNLRLIGCMFNFFSFGFRCPMKDSGCYAELLLC